MLFTKRVCLNWYSSMIFFFRKIRIIFESPKLGLFDKLSPDGDSKSGNFIWLQFILGQKPRLCRVPHHEIPLPKLIYCVRASICDFPQLYCYLHKIRVNLQWGKFIFEGALLLHICSQTGTPKTFILSLNMFCIIISWNWMWI